MRTFAYSKSLTFSRIVPKKLLLFELENPSRIPGPLRSTWIVMIPWDLKVAWIWEEYLCRIFELKRILRMSNFEEIIRNINNLCFSITWEFLIKEVIAVGVKMLDSHSYCKQSLLEKRKLRSFFSNLEAPDWWDHKLKW